MLRDVGIARFSLNLPSDSPSAEAVDRAADELRTQGLTGWTRPRAANHAETGVPGISKYTFTYWTSEDEAR